MALFIKQLWVRFKSQVPPIIKKLQILLGLASASFTAATAIVWPNKLTFIGTYCSYVAALCAAAVIALQFTQQVATIIADEKTKTQSTQKQDIN